MTKKETIIFIIICIIVISGFWWYRNQKNINHCKEECNYIPSKEPTILSPDKGDYWIFDDNKFEDQKQCLDYCLRTK